MNYRSKIIATVSLALALTVGGAVAANATVKDVGGGRFEYFVDLGNSVNFASYYHPTAYHRASVENYAYGTVRKYANAGLTAMAEEHSTLWGNHAFWWKE